MAVGGGHQEEQATVEACATLERGIELGPGPKALAGKEAHAPFRSRPRLRRRSASGPSGGGASERAALPSSACGRGSRGCASVYGCSAGTSSSSVNPMGRRDETHRPAGQTLKATGVGHRLSIGHPSTPSTGSGRLVRPRVVWYLSPVTDIPRQRPPSWFPIPAFPQLLKSLCKRDGVRRVRHSPPGPGF
jgi:hypothetical protein